MSKTLDFLEEQELNYIPAKGSANEMIVMPCPFCGTDQEKCYINTDKGLFDCKKCSEKGNLFQFKKAYGVVEGVSSLREKEGKDYKPMDEELAETYHNALWDYQPAKQYLYERGFNDNTIGHFKLGYKKDGEGGWITIPHYEDIDLWNIKSRRFEDGDKTFRRVNGQPTVLFGSDDIDYSKNALVIVESETDCMAARQMGVTNSVGLTAGADTFKPEWLEIFSQFEHVYVLLNTDDAGQKGARKIAEKIGLGKCKNIILPVNDVNDYLTNPKYSADDFKMEFSKAEKFEMKDITHVAEAVHGLDEWLFGTDSALIGIPTGFETLDNFMHGFQKEDLLVFTGDSGVGKTTFVNNMVIDTLYRGTPILGFYLEGQFNYYLSRMIGSHYDKLAVDLAKSPEWEDIKNRAADLPLYMYSGSQGGLTIERMVEVVTACVQLYDVRVVMIDNLQRFVRGDQNYTRKVSDAVSALKDLATDLDITVILIAHVRKGDRNQKVLSMQDLKDSSTIYQDADKVLILQKVKEEMYLTIEKNRMGEGDVNIAFEFKADIGKFIEKNNTAVSTDDLGKTPRVKQEDQ